MEKFTINDPEKLLKERKQIVDDVARGKKPSRIPVCSQSRAFPMLDAGYSLVEAFSDYEKTYNATMRFQEMYNFDLYTGATRFSYPVTEKLGGGGLIIDNEKGVINYVDEILIEDGEYDEFIQKGVQRFLFEKCLPRKYGLGKEDHDTQIQMIVSAMKEQAVLDKVNAKISKDFKEKLGVGRSTNASPAFYKTPIDTIETNLRGLRKFAIDMRKLPHEKMMEILKVCDNNGLEGALKRIENCDMTADDVMSQSATTSTTSWQLSAKQYEKFDWPFIKPFFDKVVETNGTCLIFPEGGFKHLMDFYRDLPAGHFTLLAEVGDLQELKELSDQLPNLSIMGGMSTYLLGHSDAKTCVDRAKEVIDTLGRDGKFIFSTDKMLSTPQDAISENLRAVNEFVFEYGVYK